METRSDENIHYEVDMPITRDFLTNFNIENVFEDDDCKEYLFGKRCKRKARNVVQANVKPKRVRLNISYDNPGEYDYVEKDKVDTEYEEVDLEHTFEEMDHETHWDNADVESPKLKSLSNQLQNLRNKAIRSRINLLPFLKNIDNFEVDNDNQKMRNKIKSMRHKEHVEDYDDDIPHIYKGVFDSQDSNFEHDILNVFVSPTTTQRIERDVPQRKRSRKGRRRNPHYPNRSIRPSHLNHPNYPNRPNHPTKIPQRPKLFRDIARLESVNPTSPFGTITYDDDIPNIYKAKTMKINQGDLVNVLKNRFRRPTVDQPYPDQDIQDYKNYQDAGDAINVNPPMDYPDETFTPREDPKRESKSRMFEENNQRREQPTANDDRRYGIVMTDNRFEQLDQIVNRMKNADSDTNKHKKRKEYDRQDWRRSKRQFHGNDDDDVKRMEEFRNNYADKSTYTEIQLSKFVCGGGGEEFHLKKFLLTIGSANMCSSYNVTTFPNLISNKKSPK